MNKILKYSLSILFLISTHTYFVSSRGKTYDDLDEILKHDGLNSTKTHVVHVDVMDQGSHIDSAKVVHKPPPQIQEERAMTSGVVIPKAYTASNPTTRGNNTKTYEQYARKQNDPNDQSLPLKYLKIPKRDRDAQFYFFLSTLLLLATTITIISSCGCLFYFLLKNLVTMQERIVDDNGSPNDNDQRAQGRQQPGNNNQFQRFEDEEQQQHREEQKQQDKLPRLLNRDQRNEQNSQEEKF